MANSKITDMDGSPRARDWIKTVGADVYITAADVAGLPAAEGVKKRVVPPEVVEEGDDADVRIESHQAGKHDQSAHGKKGPQDFRGRKVGDTFEKSGMVPGYDASKKDPIPAKASKGNADEQTALMWDDAFDDVQPSFGADTEDKLNSELDVIGDEAFDFYDNAPLVHGTTAEGAAEIETEGMQSRKAMRMETQQEIDSMLPFGEKAKIQEELDARGNSFPADSQAGLDEFVFMTHGESAGYGEVDVVVDNQVLSQEGTFATTHDVMSIHEGDLVTHKGNPMATKGNDLKDDPNGFTPEIRENYGKAAVNTSSSDYEKVRNQKYATKTVVAESVGVGVREGERSMEIKATHIEPDSVVGYTTSRSSKAKAMIDAGVPAEKIVFVTNNEKRGNAEDFFEGTGVNVVSINSSQRDVGKQRNSLFKSMQSQWDNNFDKPVDEKFDVDKLQEDIDRGPG